MEKLRKQTIKKWKESGLLDNSKLIDEDNLILKKLLKIIKNRKIVELPDVKPLNGIIELNWDLYPKINKK